MNRWKCGSNSSPVADITSSSVHQREPRNSTWSRLTSNLREPSLMNHKLTSVWPASSPTVVVTVTKAGVEFSEKEASIPSSSRHSLRAVAAGCSSGSTWPPGGRNRPAFTWSTSKTSKLPRSRITRKTRGGVPVRPALSSKDIIGTFEAPQRIGDVLGFHYVKRSDLGHQVIHNRHRITTGFSLPDRGGWRLPLTCVPGQQSPCAFRKGTMCVWIWRARPMSSMQSSLPSSRRLETQRRLKPAKQVSPMSPLLLNSSASRQPELGSPTFWSDSDPTTSIAC